MASLFEGVDLSNPCLVWPELQKAYYRLLAGDREIRIRFDREEIELGEVKPEVLLTEINRLRAECERRSGRRANYAIRAGFRRGPTY